MHQQLQIKNLKCSDNQKAVHEYKKVLVLDKKNIMANLYLAAFYTAGKEYIKAEEIFDKILSIDHENVMGLYYCWVITGKC